jgi:cell division protein FtsB
MDSRSFRKSLDCQKIMKLLFGFLIMLFLVLQFQLWLGDDSVRALNLLETELDAQRDINSGLEERNRLLEIEVVDLKTGTEAIEERARSELGMIEEGETFYLLVE